MIIVGLTGGIGSGKTTVGKFFNELGIPVYIADDEAKALMNRSKVIKRKLIELFGQKAYIDNKLNKPFLSKKIFNDKSLLEKMNAIIHPKVGSHFKRWVKKQKSPYVIKEAAILFENGNYVHCDVMITVIAPKKERLKRVINRDKTSKDSVEAIMNNQWSDTKKIKLSDFVIENDDLIDTQKKVKIIHQKILSKAQ
ncbi:MAG: dephospho-CoA kinase [Bacteroidia bacterium]|nr:dephospho-CoA kinase [Bacteroidia bacterium]MBT8278105.1 dephospho-CoA kinase [Bacteroidia bacterium]NND26793.1 dephospho-CoA kinase [Flavobacteriaceae bacterium]NNK60331.1 dephospho-CoA kinase [Flavobacteriaceae bacterium]NNL33698.1 dephospho-CoA kinase [Flavobacteriaceae bacterium]